MNLEINLDDYNKFIIKLISLNNSIITSYIKDVNYILSEDSLKLDKVEITDNEEEIMLLVEHCIFMMDNPELIAKPLGRFLKKQKGTKEQKAVFTMHTADNIKETLFQIIEIGKEKINLIGGENNANIN